MATTTRTQDIYTLVRPTWLDAAGMGKGINHDRQHLGIILGANETIKVRQINPDFTSPLVARLLHNDSETEISLNVGTDWTSLMTSVPTVPFIDTPYIDGSPQVEFEYPDNSKPLPVYKKGDNEASFLSQWENQNSEYAYIESFYTNILAPGPDITHVKDLKVQGGVDGLIDFYESLFTSFNATAGLSFQPAQSTDLNIPNRYFMKADVNGAGGAYYGTYYTAQSAYSTTHKYWLSPDITNWGCGHEIGHGYQGKFGSDTSFYTGEIWNNIYVVYWQDSQDPEARYLLGGLYDGVKEFFEWTIHDQLDKRNPVANWGLGQRLYFFILMIDAAGVSSFTHFNQLYRTNMNSAEFVPENHLILDMLADSFATSGNRIDVVPFMQLWGAPISALQRERNIYSGANAVYSLNRLFKFDTLLEQQKNLGLDTDFDLVKVDQVSSHPVTEKYRLQLKIDDFNQIYGCPFIVMDGSREVHQHIITDDDIYIPALPVGAYSLRLPFGKNKKYQPSTEYLIVKDGNNQYTIDFIPRNTSSITGSQKIWLLGTGDWSFGWMLLDFFTQSITLAITKVDPHPSYPDFYARIGIKNSDDIEFFSMEVPGKGAEILEIQLPYKSGYQIEVIHSQSGGFTTTTPGIIDSSSKNQTWNLTPFGFENVALSTDIQANYLLTIENFANELRNDPIRSKAACFSKVEIYLALQGFNSPEHKELMEAYADCLPLDNDAPDSIKAGSYFSFEYLNQSGMPSMVSQLNLDSNTLDVKTYTAPQDDGSDDVIISMKYIDRNGNTLLDLSIISGEETEMQTWALPVSPERGERITIYHKTPVSGLLLVNETQDKKWTQYHQKQTYLITDEGLKPVDA